MAPVTLTGDVTDAGGLSDMTSESFQVVEFPSMSMSYAKHSVARAADYDAASTVLSFDQSPSAEVAEYVSNVAAATNGPVRRSPDERSEDAMTARSAMALVLTLAHGCYVIALTGPVLVLMASDQRKRRLLMRQMMRWTSRSHPLCLLLHIEFVLREEKEAHDISRWTECGHNAMQNHGGD